MRTRLRLPYPWRSSGREKAAPLVESGGTVGFVHWTRRERALLVEVVADRRVDRGELLQTSHAPEPQHRPFPSSERLVGILRPVVQPAASLALVGRAERFESSTV